MQGITRLIFCIAVVMLTYFAGWPTCESKAAYIEEISFKGGGCVMASGGVCSSASATWDTSDDGNWVNVSRDFSKVESEDSEDGGGSCKGSGNGSCGKPDTAGHDSDGTHEEEELFERLPPIHMFITLKNSGNGVDTYTFTEKIYNNASTAWDGLLYVLRQDEDSRALFDTEIALTNSLNNQVLFPYMEIEDEDENAGKKLTLSGALFNFNITDVTDDFLTVTFAIDFSDIVAGSDGWNEKDGTFSVMLQCFPLLAKEVDVSPQTGTFPVPEPATMLLFGAGFTALAARKRGKRIES